MIVLSTLNIIYKILREASCINLLKILVLNEIKSFYTKDVIGSVSYKIIRKEVLDDVVKLTLNT